MQKFAKRIGLTLLCLLSWMYGCGPSPTPAPTPLPTPQNKRISEFILQEHHQYGYTMLRPASWQSADDRQTRVYFPNPQEDQLRLSLSAINLEVYANRIKGATADIRWSLFRQSPNLEGWTDALMRTLYQRDGVQYVRFSIHFIIWSFIEMQITRFTRVYFTLGVVLGNVPECAYTHSGTFPKTELHPVYTIGSI